MNSIELARKSRERLQALYELRLQHRRDIVTKSVRKLIDTVERKNNDRDMMQAAYNKFVSLFISIIRLRCCKKSALPNIPLFVWKNLGIFVFY